MIEVKSMTPEHLRRLRQGLGWTQKRMGEYAGFTDKAIWAMEAGNTPVSPRLIRVLELGEYYKPEEGDNA